MPAADLRVDVYGLPQLQWKLDALDVFMREEVDETLQYELDLMKSTAETLAPKRTGYLSTTIFVRRLKEWSFKIGASAHYAAFVEFGTRYMQARRFLSRSLEAHMPRLVAGVNRAVLEAIREAGRG